ncbi:hypothetical protein [Lacticaseibacillus jixiensis]|uniref:hypothetical protein n=1 Tax=Lacticaseibacillus jixiensis TaxID=3231926 RepID=UPI0036F2FE0E
MKTYLNRAWQWLQTDPGTLLAIVLVLPLGLWLVWRNPKYSTGFKQGFTSVGALVCMIAVIAGVTMRQTSQNLSATTKHYHTTKTQLTDTQAEYADLDDTYQSYTKRMAPYEQLAKADADKKTRDADAAAKVTDLIEAIPDEYTLTVDDKPKVQAARQAFNRLSKDQQAYADESALKTLETKLADLEKAAAAEAAKAKQEAAAAAAAAKQRAQEEARGYDTGITYDQLARTPDSYEGKKVKFSGEVVQVMEDDGSVQVRLAVNGDYDHMLLCSWSDTAVSSRVLEDDQITVSGTSHGLITYESTMGGDITIPAMSVAKVDQ